MLCIDNFKIKGFEFDATICISDLAEGLCVEAGIYGEPEDQLEIFGEYEIKWEGSFPIPVVLNVYVVVNGESFKLSPFDIDYFEIAEEIKLRENSHIDAWYQDKQETAYNLH